MSIGASGAHRLRSILFCPGSRPERFAKGLASGADAVCLDLEDGVAPDDKDAARANVVAWLEAHGGGVEGGDARRRGPAVVVRINDPTGDLGRRDLEALGAAPLPDLLMIPKTDGLASITHVLDTLRTAMGPRAPGAEVRLPHVLPLIETAHGLDKVRELTRGSTPVAALVFGGMDLAADLGARFEWEPLLWARSRLVHAAALGGVGIIDVPWAALDDPAGLEAETRRVARLGFTGKLAIHPGQVEPIHRGMAPDPDELAAARRIVAASEAAKGGVAVVDGKMVDRPLVLGALRILARAGEG